jgi:hypothetical protein
VHRIIGKIFLQNADVYFRTVEDTGSERSIHVGLSKYIEKVTHCAGTSRSD